MKHRYLFALLLLCYGITIHWVPSAQSAEESFEEFVKNEQTAFNTYLDEQERDYAAYVREVRAKWGEFLGSTRRVWVDYGNQKESRSRVDFQQGVIIVDAIVPKTEESFKELASEKIERQIKRMVSDNWPTGKNPLADQIEIDQGETLSDDNVDDFIKEQLKEKMVVKKAPLPQEDSTPQQMVSVKFNMVPNHMRIRAEKYIPLIEKYCNMRNLDPSIICGLVETESAWNPMARSHIPAYGLMQIVPASGGRDAYKYVYKKDKKPSADFLYTPENNINLGTAYLNLTKDVYFKGVEDNTKAYLLTVAAYNTGPGNVAKALTGGTRLAPAAEKANRMSIEEVHKTLRKQLPYEETQKYIQKVFNRSKRYR